ncbi:hypothetical protein [Paraliobacillus zengyii]|nr:hypothetical protein [Paraliobacillus zengyii]
MAKKQKFQLKIRSEIIQIKGFRIGNLPSITNEGINSLVQAAKRKASG